ncbi:hypothetical protein ES705_39015 [subsurface metagenome]
MDIYLVPDPEAYYNNDLFILTTGPTTTALDISITWITLYDDINFILHNDAGGVVDSSMEPAVDSEPATPPFSVTELSSNSIYYVRVNFYLHGNTGQKTEAGTLYTLTITGSN